MPETLRGVDPGRLEHDSTETTRRVTFFLTDFFADPVSDLARAEIAVAVAEALPTLSGRAAKRLSIDVRAVELARDYLAAHACEQTPAS